MISNYFKKMKEPFGNLRNIITIDFSDLCFIQTITGIFCFLGCIIGEILGLSCFVSIVGGIGASILLTAIYFIKEPNLKQNPLPIK
jgi:hypothetical protein